MALADSIAEELGERLERKVAELDLEWDRDFIERLLPWMESFARYFDAEVRGFERVPEGAALLVGNHSGGSLVPDTPALLAAWYREFGTGRPLVGLALDAIFAIPGMEALMRKLGEVPASPGNAERALAAGHPVLVYPGGAHEAFRPWTDRNRIDFGGHQGYVRLALRAGVPVVPVVGHGGHETLVVLSRGDWLARQPISKRLRLGAAPIVWSWPWGIGMPFVPGVPLPAKIEVELLEPIYWSDLGPEDADDPAVVDRCDAELRERMQKALTRMAERRPRPLLDRLSKLLPVRGSRSQAA